MNPPPPIPPSYQQYQDAEHLKLLSVFHYVMAGLTLIGGILGGFYMLMGLLFMKSVPMMPKGPGTSPPPPGFENFGWFFIVIGGAIGLLCLALAACQIMAARWMSARRNKTFCLVMAGIECLNFPLGTALGVFTFLVLSRPSVAATFEQAETGFATPHA